MATYGPENFATRDGRTLVLRHCLPSDAETYVEFQQQIARETQHTLQTVEMKPDPQKVRQVWAELLGDPRDLRLGAFDGDRMVGQIMVFRAMRPHPWTDHVAQFGMMILQKFWGQGLGRKLLEAIDTHARAQCFTRIQAEVRVNNPRDIELYRRCGYQIEGTLRNLSRINGEYVDVHVIAKLLDQSKPRGNQSLEV